MPFRGARVRIGIALTALAALAFGWFATSTEAEPLPADGVVTLEGHGWGHGKGLGQWGARGMAEDGKTDTTILKHFYRGTAFKVRNPESIRVLVESGRDVLVTSDEVFSAWWKGGDKIADSTTSKPFLRAIPTGDGLRLLKSASHEGPWSTVANGTKSIIFKPGGALLQLVFSTESVRYYRGKIEARRSSSTLIHSVNQLSLEHYLRGVVPREMPALWPMEALQAQAQAARTYAVYQKDGRRAQGKWFDICADTQCQVYGGQARKSSPDGEKDTLEHSRSNKAIKDTAGRVMNYDGKPILAQFSSSTGGYTAPGGTPYLKAVPDDADAIAPYHTWTKKVKVADIEAEWPEIGRLVSVRVTERNGYGDWGGRVRRVSVAGTKDTVSVSGGTFRSAFGMKSDWFRVGSAGATSVSAQMAGKTFATAFPKKATDRFVVAWKGTGAKSYDVRVRHSSARASKFSDWRTWKRRITRRSAYFNGVPGHTYCLAVRPRDKKGHRGSWSAERCTAVALDDTDFKADSGRWTRGSNHATYLGTYTRGRTDGAVLVRRVKAKRIWLVATRCPGCGTIEVLLDGKRLAKISLNSSEWKRERILPVAAFSSVRSGRLKIRVLKAGKRGAVIEGVGVSKR